MTVPTCGTTASLLALQCASILETCSVDLGRRATVLFPSYFPIQSLSSGYPSTGNGVRLLDIL